MTKITKKTGKKRAARSSSKVVSIKTKKPFSNYRQATAYLFEKTDYEKEEHVRYNVTTFSLDRMRNLLSLLGDPHAKINTVHIAGTKGKGSTATMLAKMLESNGYTVGLYTSPHLVHLHERIVVNSQMISEAEMLGLMNRIYALSRSCPRTIRPRFSKS
jgi:dihydrofolate synthase/folylpolyglutamate synthase